ncbi:MAG: hypothetical protein CO042_00085 [Parcubacteria group bacterium CG_4_9_14_0_2_um_filter_41_8]|nr:MAG: hypothetical protein AUJ34_01090 [Parcubacteria group bacterium CG1_02_41_12]PIP66856.1 MAG: hypothetical protein COW93_03350 [Parcubacteria group bacterium CG22_combo_CG10-13_8_21_14_all_41_9]PIQ80330.1 MAG: hypothetical protein COV79_01095 [Parcubacteria group bacterium CG11_big_fil_rev_8_21_14_0_20_41_14]PIR57186.1 MAG: hypothetical protein COU72_02245 [Parcubacteria group bacterium CG10_big_fil_rev_8_21_14_0_10_41_35]PIZ80394.1 MAG: hypothetical protein COY02_03555 [Parcubacteria gr
MKSRPLATLEQFPEPTGLPQSDRDIIATMQSCDIQKILIYALGPEGTNISQAAAQWINRAGVRDKSEIILCETPEHSLEMASAVNEKGAIGLFGTCAVYFALNKLFFENPGCLPFFVEEVMYLDEMQLAARYDVHADLGLGIADGTACSWVVASHPSPAPLVRNLGCEVKLVNSNAQAADDVAVGNVQLCITTESARKSRRLIKLHSFGSPAMVFFYGIAGESIQVVRSAFARLEADKQKREQEMSLA